MKSKNNPKRQSLPPPLAKSPTGIRGLDEITGGGLPTGRVTLVCGGAGSGKTLLGMSFLVNGSVEYHEPGVIMAFEETEEELTQNVVSLGFDLGRMVAQQQLLLDYVRVDPADFEAGAYDLEGLFIRLNHAIDTIGAKRVVLDTIEVLFGGLPNPAIVRAELQRLFKWLKAKGVTTILTAEKGERSLTRHGLEEYVSDCVISLDNRVVDITSTRRMRVVKYRGSAHGMDEYPFLIEKQGFLVWPVTALTLEYPASEQRISTGVKRLDTMLGGKGFYRGSTILITGTAGTGKSSLAATFADAACRRRERCLIFSFEESSSQVMRDMRSIGVDLQQWINNGRLRFCAVWPSFIGLETHLARIMKEIGEFAPAVVIVDPISSLATGNAWEMRAMFVRLTDFLKRQGLTAVLTSLTVADGERPTMDTSITSRVDTWLVLRDLELNGERNRGLEIIKSRGIAHSNQVREFLMTSEGIMLKDVYVGSQGLLTGSARLSQEIQEQGERLARKEEIERQHLLIESKRCLLDTQVAALRAEFATEASDVERLIRQETQRAETQVSSSMTMGRGRQADTIPNGKNRLNKNDAGRRQR